MVALKREESGYRYLDKTYKSNDYRQARQAKIYYIEDYQPLPKKYLRFLFIIKKNIFLALISISLFAMICIGCHSFFVSAKSSLPSIGDRQKYYTEIRIEPGDTLWNIADSYITAEYKNVNEYINEVMELNSMSSKDIYYGEKLLVPYYSYDKK